MVIAKIKKNIHEINQVKIRRLLFNMDGDYYEIQYKQRPFPFSK